MVFVRTPLKKIYKTVIIWLKGDKFQYEIDPRHKDDFVKFFNEPTAPKEKKKDPDWSMQGTAEEIYFLEDNGFDAFARDQEEMFAMFYSNSCGACSRCKLGYYTTVWSTDYES